MADKNAELLLQAVARNLGAVLSLPSAGMLRHYKSRFLAEQDGGLILEAPGSESPLIKELIQTRAPCGVSFRGGAFKVMFACPILRAEPGWRINADTVVDAVLLEFPTVIKALQRRANYRVEIPMDTDVSLRVWRIAEKAQLKAEPASSQEIKARIRDLSTGGVGVTLFGTKDDKPRIDVADRLRVLLQYGQQSLIVEGRMRLPTAAALGNDIITGIQFKKLEDDLEGRRVLAQLTRLVGELQREETRRVRLGLAKAG